VYATEGGNLHVCNACTSLSFSPKANRQVIHVGDKKNYTNLGQKENKNKHMGCQTQRESWSLRHTYLDILLVLIGT
jgi:hypothetical protein